MSSICRGPRRAAKRYISVRQLQKLGDALALRAFLADVCVGDADDGRGRRADVVADVEDARERLARRH